MIKAVTQYLLIMTIFLIAAPGLTEVEKSYGYEKTEAKSIIDMGQAELNYGVAAYNNSTAQEDLERHYLATTVEHQKKLMEIAENAYTIQHWMTIGIFFIVSALVIGGFYLSYLQLRSDKGQSPQGPTTIKVGQTGIEVSSSVIGLVVLFMSFLFFHLYVKDVYSIKIDKVEPIKFGASAIEVNSPKNESNKK